MLTLKYCPEMNIYTLEMNGKERVKTEAELMGIGIGQMPGWIEIVKQSPHSLNIEIK
jgi:hypothetical protein